MTSHTPQPPLERRRRRSRTDLQRLMAKVSVNPVTGCWDWTACKTPAGYGQFWFQYRRNNFAHRAAYMLLVGPIPEGKVIDHLCRNRACCNPAHLEPVENRTNLVRGSGFCKWALSDECPNGHPYTPENLYVRPSSKGRRECRECRRTYSARRAQRELEAQQMHLEEAA